MEMYQTKYIFYVEDKRYSIEKQVGEKIKQSRKQKHMTQEQLADAASLHPISISYIESGKRNISLRILKQLADGLDMNMKDLLP